MIRVSFYFDALQGSNTPRFCCDVHLEGNDHLLCRKICAAPCMHLTSRLYPAYDFSQTVHEISETPIMLWQRSALALQQACISNAEPPSHATCLDLSFDRPPDGADTVS